MKEESLMGINLKANVKQVIGTCNSMGILVEGVPAVDAIKQVNEGKFDEEIKLEKTELSEEEKKKLEEEKKKLAAEIEKRRKKFESLAKKIIDTSKGKSRGEIKTKLVEAKVPLELIEELLPVEGAAEGEKPAEGEVAKAEETPEEEKKE